MKKETRKSLKINRPALVKRSFIAAVFLISQLFTNALFGGPARQLEDPRTAFQFEEDRSKAWQILNVLEGANEKQLRGTYKYLGSSYILFQILNNTYSSEDLLKLLKVLEHLSQIEAPQSNKWSVERLLSKYVTNQIFAGAVPSSLEILADNFDAIDNIIRILALINTKKSADELYQLEVKMKAIAALSFSDRDLYRRRADQRLFTLDDWLILARKAHIIRVLMGERNSAYSVSDKISSRAALSCEVVFRGVFYGRFSSRTPRFSAVR